MSLLLIVAPQIASASTIFGQVRGVVHDAQHRPIRGATVTVHSAHSAFESAAHTNQDGTFSLPAIPLGEYTVAVSQPGFRTVQQGITLASDTSPLLHFELPVGDVSESITVTAEAGGANPNSATPTTLVGRVEIEQTPGADRTNSLAMITDYVPGAYIAHDMLHMRGGHQVSWLLDGIEIPNTNIASNLGPQIDPKDIDYLEVQRGSYTSDVGDRTFGVFNVVPRSGFERDREAELVVTAGSFLQTNDQISFGDHTSRSAYYASLNGHRSDYGLSPPVGHVYHDASDGFGGFASFLDNTTPKDQLRLIVQLRNDSFEIPNDSGSSGLRDHQHEEDGVVASSWLHTFNPGSMLQVSPFFHYNRADYEPDASDTPVATTSQRSSNYAGAQASLTVQVARNMLEAGLYSFGQHDGYRFGAVFHDGSGESPFSIPDAASGGVIEENLSDSYKATSWLTVLAGVRETLFRGQFTESATAPRFGVAVRLPRLNWVFRGFYGRFYQPPPLLTASGPLVQFAEANNTAFRPLHGERDEEHQFGVQIPYRGWLLDVDTFKTRINNFLDHSNIGNSSIYFPVTIDGARVRAWELALRSPRLRHGAQVHLAYSNQIAEQRGGITGGLICTPVGDPACSAGFEYRPVDHDQRNTLTVGFNTLLPFRIAASTNVMYGSGLTNGGYDPAGEPADPRYPNQYLPAHTTVDLSLRRSLGRRTQVSVTALNLANRRVLLDNSLTFGGFHYNDPREIYGEVRYRFRY
ncbi:MAG: TonB-dependent receptor [Acidobacteriota bacterium]|nr:TonB-dependent receptor [Acidobacteriota bacterium]